MVPDQPKKKNSLQKLPRLYLSLVPLFPADVSTCKEKELIHLNPSANQNSSLIHRVIQGVIFSFSKA